MIGEQEVDCVGLTELVVPTLLSDSHGDVVLRKAEANRQLLPHLLFIYDELSRVVVHPIGHSVARCLEVEAGISFVDFLLKLFHSLLNIKDLSGMALSGCKVF